MGGTVLNPGRDPPLLEVLTRCSALTGEIDPAVIHAATEYLPTIWAHPYLADRPLHEVSARFAWCAVVLAII